MTALSHVPAFAFLLVTACSTNEPTGAENTPDRACDPNDAAQTCAPPPGKCELGLLFYYTAPICQDGTCRWQKKSYNCTYGCAEQNGKGYCRDKGFTAGGPSERGDYFF